MTGLLIFLGAAVGAPLRYLTDRAVQRRHDSLFPWGTFTVNALGSLLLGGLVGAAGALPHVAMPVLGTGFCGALTTYSTFSFETLRLLEQRSYLYAAANVLAGVAAAVGAATLGFTLGSVIAG